MPQHKNTIDKFWSKVDIKSNEECWNWLGYCDPRGYGKVSFQGRKLGAYKLAWILTYGEVENGLYVLHNPEICKNPACCNPNHLRLGTSTENRQDSDVAKLNWIIVNKIRDMYLSNLYTQKELGKLFDIHQTHVGKIIRNEIWKI